MVIRIIVIFIVCLMAFIIIRNKLKHKELSKSNMDRKEYASDEYEMIEYSREQSYKLGFHKEDIGFKRPVILKRKGITDKEELFLEAAKRNNPSFSAALENLIPLSKLHTETYLLNKTIRVFVDTQKDTRIIAIDHSAILEIDLNEFYDIAGKFVLINLDKNENKITINFILEDGVVTTEKESKNRRKMYEKL